MPLTRLTSLLSTFNQRRSAAKGRGADATETTNAAGGRRSPAPVYLHSHHKCASRWAIGYSQDVARRNGLRFFHSDLTQDVAAVDSDLIFFGNSDYAAAAAQGLNGVHFIRNPLNILVSAYFSHLNTHSEDGWTLLSRQRALLKAVSLQDGLHLTNVFLDRSDINQGAVGPLYALRKWNYDDPRFHTIRIEDMVSQPSAALRQLPAFANLDLPADAAYGFAAISGGRAIGEIDDHSHYRSGDPNEWKKYITEALLLYAQSYFAPLLRRYYPEVMIEGHDLDKPFYELHEDVRIALTHLHITTRQTMVQRWQHLQTGEAKDWNARTEQAADWLHDCASVADLGCGTRQLEQALRAKATQGKTSPTYLAVDVVPRGDSTIIVDFNQKALPKQLTADAAAVLGLLEYLHQPQRLLRQCRAQFKTLVLSYNCQQTPDDLNQRRQHAWVNDFSEADIDALVRAAGWQITAKIELGEAQVLWKLT